MSPVAPIRFLLAQTNFRVGDLQGNTLKIKEICKFASQNIVNIVIFPEMALPGYPIKDLIFDRDFIESEQEHLSNIAKEYPELYIILGGFGQEKDPNHHPRYQNNAYILHKGKIQHHIAKRLTPTYDVFDEKRYFWSGTNYQTVTMCDLPFGIAICEDLWDHDYNVDVAANFVSEGAKFIISINGSPYYIGKQKFREQLIRDKVKQFGIPIIYLNAIGGQDELVLDGRSFIFDASGELVLRAPFCQERLMTIDYSPETQRFKPVSSDQFPFEPIKQTTHNMPIIPEENITTFPIIPLIDTNEEICEALAMNLRDYYKKTGVFDCAVIGLSGGVDSAFTAYITCQALGAEKVIGLLMPSKYSSQGSIDDSIHLCKNLGMKYHIVPIKESHALLENQLDSLFLDPASSQNLDLSHQNLQSRIRGINLMYYSNKNNALVVSTGNKSEIATGYCTLYGDTNGGKNVPGDLYKTQLYQVCKWINRNKEIIPWSTITKPPSAELKEEQIDEDNLPPYPTLDEILQLRIDEGLSPREIIALGKNSDLVYRIERLYTYSEFKRAQLVQTIKINKKTFGSGRKIPVLKHATY
ncbi:MAG: NAD+ synthase [Promethearchaeota archaeon]